MAISGISGLSGMNQYKISSINGNPGSLNPVRKIGQDTDRSGKPLVIASSDNEKQSLYIKDYGELEKINSTAVGGFADMLSIQTDMLASGSEPVQQQNSMTSFLNDTIGVMGYQNQLRDQLMGTGFVPFDEV